MIEVLERFLERLEEKETPLLVWGIADTSFTEDELLQVLETSWNDVPHAYSDTTQILRDLLIAGLVHRVPMEGLVGGEVRYRTRMAETVRLMSRLRQMFPKHKGNHGWKEAATLVSDYRFMRQPRRFPNRNVEARQVLESLDPNRFQSYFEFLEALLNRKNFKISKFQHRGAKQILENLEKSQSTGTIICAGTGSGKTLAFYLPALARIARRIQEDEHNPWVKALAIYPRNELLKDQFSEVYTEALRLNAYLKQKGLRKIRIGAFFGPVPHNSSNPALKSKETGWLWSKEGYICRYLRCPTESCQGQFVWPERDRNAGRERLVCTSCGHQVSDDEVQLTRQSIQHRPPDILFTTTEMMNRNLSNGFCRHLFGIGSQAKQAPDFMLLDEVHTYVGQHGAQVAYLLRRWQEQVRGRVQFIGLSATLMEAASFFGQLTGVNPEHISEVSPDPQDMVKKGSEYFLILRGDPVSRVSLLSTTIQTGMLATRIMDSKELKSRGLYGSKVFLFTDDIDVTNRLYFNILDTEKRNSFGEVTPEEPLSALRAKGPNHQRYLNGQDWRFCEELGHNLRDKMRIGRTSSQDPGVSGESDLIVATASLEVGFNDPEVGAVIQHKAPRDMASYIQRKGRAGRRQSMHPWTFVVLSDYGRDRLMYQSYEQFFDPELKARHLPLNNRHIRRMQAVYCLIDFLSHKVTQDRGNTWELLSHPKNQRSNTDLDNDKFKNEIIKILNNILNNEPAQQEFEEFLKLNLGFKHEHERSELLSILWEFPRPVLTTAVPTAIRRLTTNWSWGRDFFIKYAPLPEFIPANLFSDLNLPEVKILIKQSANLDEEEFYLPAFQALRHFAPGKVSKRFAILHKFIRNWFVPKQWEEQITAFDFDLKDGVIDLADEDRFSVVKLGEYEFMSEDGVSKIPVYRPMEFRPQTSQALVSENSNAFLKWFTQIVTQRTGHIEVLPRDCGWNRYIEQVEFFLHNQQNPIEMRRFTTGSQANMNFDNGDSVQAQVSLTYQEQPAAMGISQIVDGVVFHIHVPERLWDSAEYTEPKWRSLRTTKFFEEIVHGEAIESEVNNHFAREWLAQAYLTALVHEALVRDITLKESAQALAQNTAQINLTEILHIIFQSPPAPTEEDMEHDIEHVQESAKQERLKADLKIYLEMPDIVEALGSMAASCLWEDIDASWEPWLKKHYLSTLGTLLFQAIEIVCSDLDTSMIILDLEQFHQRQPCEFEEIWITENSIGSCGIIEAFLTRYRKDPRRFFALLDSLLKPSDLEIIDQQLTRLMPLIQEDYDIRSAIQAMRDATSLSGEQLLKDLCDKLRLKGFSIFHGFVSALFNRILRPGSSQNHDHLLSGLLTKWQDEELRLSIDIDARIIAYVESRKHEHADFNSLYSMLWPKGREVRQKHLSTFNPFARLPLTEKLMLDSDAGGEGIRSFLIDTGPTEVWLQEVQQELGLRGSVRLTCSQDALQSLKPCLNALMVNPVEIDEILHVYPRIKGLRRDARAVEIDLELVEVL